MYGFPTFFGNKITWCKVIIYVLFYTLSAKNLIILTVFTWFLILDKIQDGGQDGDHVWKRYRPPAAPPPIKYTSCCREDQRLSTEGKIVSKYWNISKAEGGSFNPPSPLARWGYDRVYVQGLNFSKEGQIFVFLRTSEQYGNVSVVLLTYLTVFPRQSCFAITLMTILVIYRSAYTSVLAGSLQTRGL